MSQGIKTRKTAKKREKSRKYDVENLLENHVAITILIYCIFRYKKKLEF